jgi:hypothetical protein
MPAAGNSTEVGDRRNTIGYQFNARSNETRDNVTAKVDYNLSTRNVFAASYIWNRDIVDRPDLGSFYTTAPPVSNDNHAKLIAASWRFNPKPTLVNELRGGCNLAPGVFNVSSKYAAVLPSIASLLFDPPVNTFLKQGRNTNTFNLQDNVSWVRGKHNVRFGYQSQFIRVERFNDAGTVPTMTLGIAPTNPIGFTAGDIPGASTADITTANSLLANMAGIVSSASQTFNVTSRTSAFVAGSGLLQHWSYDSHSWYVTDNWKLRPRLTLVVGLRYDYFNRLNERDSLILLPQIMNGNFIQTLLSNATTDFAGKAVGRPYYNKDLNNFAPNIGVAWDMFGDGKTSLRAGYSVAYVNDDAVEQLVNDIGTNAGLSSTASLTNQNARLSVPPTIPSPTFKVPRTFADNFAVNPTANAQGLPDPGLRSPYVQQWSLGIQRQVKGFVVEGRYIGNHGVKGWRQFDYNQVVIRENGFLPDFLKAQNNGFLALNAGKGFNPAFDATVPGSQPLPFFDRLPSGGTLTNPTIRGQIQRGEIGTLGQTYFTNRLAGPVVFFNNPNGLGMNSIGSYSNSSYNGLQIDVSRRVAHGMQFQVNYTYGKALTDASANGVTRGFEPFLDMNNPRLERARATFDLRHAIKLNHAIPLPFGQGHRLSYGPLNRVIGGWTVSGFLTLQSGPPVSILSTRGTLNRGARSTQNTATTLLTGDQLQDIVGFRMTGDGPMFINPSAIGSNGQGVAPDGSRPFSEQVFFNPSAGTVGTLQRRFFSGQWYNSYDFGLLKDTKITERQSIQLNANFYNLTNHPNFFVDDHNINSANFGKISEMFYSASGIGPRVIQFGLYYKF